jgi:hypothetical protein
VCSSLTLLRVVVVGASTVTTRFAAMQMTFLGAHCTAAIFSEILSIEFQTDSHSMSFGWSSTSE